MLSYLVCGPDAAATDRVLGELADGVAALLGGDGDLDTVLQGLPGRGEVYLGWLELRGLVGGLQCAGFGEVGCLLGLDLGSAVRQQQEEAEVYLVRLAGLLAVSVGLDAEEGAGPVQEVGLDPGGADQQGAAGQRDYLGGAAAAAVSETGRGRQSDFQESRDLVESVSEAGRTTNRPWQELAGAWEEETDGAVDYIA